MIRISRPLPEAISRFLSAQRELPYTYPTPGATRDHEPPAGFVVDHRRGELGRGAEAFTAALGTTRFRPYRSHDPIGVEIGGAVKNLLAIARRR